ncbi:MAG: folate-binding protein [Rhodospirillales bacterium]|nr:MAG: folate-binding protein [Rhodospirillales bacterium]
MTGNGFVLLEDRGVLAIGGPDRATFLQGLVSNDVNKVTPERAIHAALLSPQGKFLFDFFIASHGESLLLDCEGARLGELARRLGLYRLRSKVALSDRSEALVVAALPGPAAAAHLHLPPDAGTARGLDQGIVFVDPRLAEAGARAILPRGRAEAILHQAGLAPRPRAEYERLRLRLGLPDGSRDMVVDKAILLENGFDELNGVDWEKGCFMGQELTARTRYRGLVKKRLLPVRIDGDLPPPGTAVRQGQREVGEVRSGQDDVALALIRLEALEQPEAPLLAGDARLTPITPSWARLERLR